jgi:hypothetical protein
MEHIIVDVILHTFILSLPGLNPGRHNECTECCGAPNDVIASGYATTVSSVFETSTRHCLEE